MRSSLKMTVKRDLDLSNTLLEKYAAEVEFPLFGKHRCKNKKEEAAEKLNLLSLSLKCVTYV